MLPALDRADCAAFGEAVYRFGRLAGECFAAVQGGPFANREIGRLIDAIRDVWRFGRRPILLGTNGFRDLFLIERSRSVG